MRLDYETGRETIAWIEPGIEQQVVVVGLAAVSRGIKDGSIKLDGNFIERRKNARRLGVLQHNATSHLRQSAYEIMCLMGEFELEMVQKGLNRILETGEFGDSFMPAAPGGNELDLAIAEILGREEVRSSAETISLALASREV